MCTCAGEKKSQSVHCVPFFLRLFIYLFFLNSRPFGIANSLLSAMVTGELAKVIAIDVRFFFFSCKIFLLYQQ